MMPDDQTTSNINYNFKYNSFFLKRLDLAYTPSHTQLKWPPSKTGQARAKQERARRGSQLREGS
jgi:hypothetical protein